MADLPFAAQLSPRARAAADHVTAIEAELAQLRADVAPALERIAILERSLDALELAALPGQLPLLDAGPAAPVLAPLREPSRMAEELLRKAVDGTGELPWSVTIPRDKAHRGELKCAHALAHGERPLLAEESRTASAVVYRLTADGEAVARALPPRVAS